jgi:hypothetical protein
MKTLYYCLLGLLLFSVECVVCFGLLYVILPFFFYNNPSILTTMSLTILGLLIIIPFIGLYYIWRKSKKVCLILALAHIFFIIIVGSIQLGYSDDEPNNLQLNFNISFSL